MATTAASNWTARQAGRVKPFFLPCRCFIRWGGGCGSAMPAGELPLRPNPPIVGPSGIWALVALLITLAITPLRRLVGQPALVRLRRDGRGLFWFVYTRLHFVWVPAWTWNAGLGWPRHVAGDAAVRATHNRGYGRVCDVASTGANFNTRLDAQAWASLAAIAPQRVSDCRAFGLAFLVGARW